MAKQTKPSTEITSKQYQAILRELTDLIELARLSTVRTVNTLMTATYWLVGRGIVEHEQAGQARAEYGQALLKKLAEDLTKRFGRGFSRQNLQQMRQFYLAYPLDEICQTPSGILTEPASEQICQTPSGVLQAVSTSSLLPNLAQQFPLPWSAYVRLLAIKNAKARRFYETEAVRGGWSVRQLDRQVNAQFYERTALSKNKTAMLTGSRKPKPEDIIAPEEQIKDPYVLEFLDLKDEYSENDLEAALIHHLEEFLLELGGDFCFVGRQKRLRIGQEWYRMDLVFFHRRLRCLMIVDLKIGKFTHADAGQMHLYLNYAREHWTHADENPPVGLILCAQKDDAVARYALEGLPNKIMASEYRMTLPDEDTLVAEIERTRHVLESHGRLLPSTSPKPAKKTTSRKKTKK